MSSGIVTAPGVASWRPDDSGAPRAYTPDGKPYVWAPLPPAPGERRSSQELFLACPVYEALLEGNRGGGKTQVLGADFFADVGVGWGSAWRGLIVRQTTNDFDTFADKLYELARACWKGGVQFNRSKGLLHFRWATGERLDLRAIAHPRDYQGRHGGEYTWLGLEELTTWPTPDVYLLLHSVIRTGVPNIFTRIRATTNPGLAGHGWVKERFDLPVRGPGRVGRIIHNEGERPRVAIHSDLRENIVLRYADPDYINNLHPPSEALRRAWVDGDWDIVAGGLVDDIWDAGVHVVAPFEIPRTWRLFRSFDWGDSAPFSVGWWAESDGSDYRDGAGELRSSVRGDLFRFSEWYGMTKPNVGLGLSPQLVAQGIVERELAMGVGSRVGPGPADSEIWNNRVGGVNIAQMMAQPVRVNGVAYPGVQWVRADKSPGTRKSSWVILRAYLRNALPSDKGSREHPGVFFFEGCDQTRRMLPQAPRSERDPEDIDKNYEDHLLDDIRYALLSVTRQRKGGRVSGLTW